MTAEELGMSPEAVEYVDAILYLAHDGIGFKYRRAKHRAAMGCADEEDRQIITEYENEHSTSNP